jgi:hypothetical protein
MDALPPFAVAEPVFPLRALALAASKAPLGGVREALMATLVAARLSVTAHGPTALPAEQRVERAAAARHWMGALTLPAAVRNALGQLIDATARDDATALAMALTSVTEVTAAHLDRKARSELDRLTRAVRP